MAKIVKAIKIKKSFSDLGCAVFGSDDYNEILKLRENGVEEDFEIHQGTWAVQTGDIVFLSQHRDSDYIYTTTISNIESAKGKYQCN